MERFPLHTRSTQNYIASTPTLTDSAMSRQTEVPMFKTIFVSAVAAVMLATSAQPAFAEEQNSPLFKSARLRYLSQRIAKAYVQSVLGVRTEKAQAIIESSVKQSHTLIFELKKTGGAGPDISKALTDFETQASALYVTAGMRDGGDRVSEIVKLSDAAFATGNRLAAAYQAQDKTPYGKLQNVAGRERGLSQRIARDFFIQKLGKAGKSVAEESRSQRSEFKAALDLLINAPISTPAIKNDLMLVQTQWLFFEQAVDNASDPNSATNVATTSERILEVLDDLVDQYDQVMRSLN